MQVRHIISVHIADERAYRNSILEKHGLARIWPPPRCGSFPPHVVHARSALVQFSTGSTFQQWATSEPIGVLDVYPMLGLLCVLVMTYWLWQHISYGRADRRARRLPDAGPAVPAAAAARLGHN